MRLYVVVVVFFFRVRTLKRFLFANTQLELWTPSLLSTISFIQSSLQFSPLFVRHFFASLRWLFFLPFFLLMKYSLNLFIQFIFYFFISSIFSAFSEPPSWTIPMCCCVWVNDINSTRSCRRRRRRIIRLWKPRKRRRERKIANNENVSGERKKTVSLCATSTGIAAVVATFVRFASKTKRKRKETFNTQRSQKE